MRLLLVEDEPLIALETRDILVRAGHEVVGPALTAEAARCLTEHEPLDAALLDLNLAGTLAWDIAQALGAKRVPFAILSGYDTTIGVPRDIRVTHWMAKPFDASALVALIDELAPSGSRAEERAARA